MQALAHAMQICKCIPSTDLQPATNMPPPPHTHSERQPPISPERPSSVPSTSRQPIVLRGRIVSNAHFERVKIIIEHLPPNIQQFMRNHQTKVIATDTLIGQRPELYGVQPRAWGGRTWDNSDGEYDKSRNEVIVADRALVGQQWIPSMRVDSVARHETGHAIDHNMGDFSHHNREFINTYNREKSRIPRTVRESLNYILQRGDAGREETFSELFATLYGGAAEGQQNQHLIETYFHETLTLIRSTMSSLR